MSFARIVYSGPTRNSQCVVTPSRCVAYHVYHQNKCRWSARFPWKQHEAYFESSLAAGLTQLGLLSFGTHEANGARVRVWTPGPHLRWSRGTPAPRWLGCRCSWGGQSLACLGPVRRGWPASSLSLTQRGLFTPARVFSHWLQRLVVLQ